MITTRGTPHYVQVKKSDLILMHSINLDLFQLRAFALMQTAC
jgi:hypothetical protein